MIDFVCTLSSQIILYTSTTGTRKLAQCRLKCYIIEALLFKKCSLQKNARFTMRYVGRSEIASSS